MQRSKSQSEMTANDLDRAGLYELCQAEIAVELVCDYFARRFSSIRFSVSRTSHSRIPTALLVHLSPPSTFLNLARLIDRLAPHRSFFLLFLGDSDADYDDHEQVTAV